MAKACLYRRAASSGRLSRTASARCARSSNCSWAGVCARIEGAAKSSRPSARAQRVFVGQDSSPAADVHVGLFALGSKSGAWRTRADLEGCPTTFHMLSTLRYRTSAILESMRIVALLIAAGAACAQSSSPEQLFRDAVAAQQHGDDALAVRKYQELLKRYPDAVEVRANLGAALAKLERYDEAIEQYRAVLAKKDNAGLRLNLALAYYKKGALREAVQQLSTLQGAQPGDPRVATLLADCYARLGQDRQAIAVLTPVEAAHPDDLAVAWLLGSALIRAGHKRDGLERVDRVARQGNRPEAYLLAGQTALKMNEFERARDYADAALRLNPRLPGADTLRGTVLS